MTDASDSSGSKPAALLKKLYTYTIFSNLMFIFPFYGVIFADHGLNAAQIALLFVISTATKLICEVPSGILADRYSRRNLLCLAQIMRVASLGCWLFFPSFWGYAIGFVVWGMGSSLISGTLQALLYDELTALGKNSAYIRISGRLSSLSLASIVASTLLASPAFLYGYSFVLSISMISAGLAAISAVLLPSPQPQLPIAKSEGKSLKHSVHAAIRQIQLLKIAAFASYIGLIGALVQEYSPLFTKESGISTLWVPAVLALILVPAIVAGSVAHRFRLSSLQLINLLAASGLLLFLCGYFIGIAGLFFIALTAALLQFLTVTLDSMLQHSITSEARATVTSLSAFSTQIAIILGLLAYGAIASSNQNAGAFMAFGALTVAVAIVYLAATHGKLFAKNKQVSS